MHLGCDGGFADHRKPKKLDWSEFPQVKWPADPNYPRFVFPYFGTVENVKITTSLTPIAARSFSLIFSGPIDDMQGYEMAYCRGIEICEGNELDDVGNRSMHFSWLDPNYPVYFAYWSTLAKMV